MDKATMSIFYHIIGPVLSLKVDHLRSKSNQLIYGPRKFFGKTFVEMQPSIYLLSCSYKAKKAHILPYLAPPLPLKWTIYGQNLLRPSAAQVVFLVKIW